MKKFLTVKNVLVCFGFVFGLVAFFMMFTDQLYASVFGYTGYVSYKDALFGDYGAVLSFVGYLLVLVGALCGCCLAFLKDKKIRNLGTLVAALLLIVGAIFIFLEPVLYASGDFKDTIKLAAGPIVAGVLAILSGLCYCASVFVKDK